MCFNPSPVRRVPSPNRYMAVAKFCFCKNNKRLIDCTCAACAHSAAGHDLDAELMQLENTCYAAKQCGVEKCAGTLVNMRKPLCNLGQVLTSELQSARVLLQALWRLIAGKISSVVELTHQRREHYICLF